VSLHVPLLDDTGGVPLAGHPTRSLEDGEMCWFSSAGPTVTGVPKPEISAPGGLVIAAMAKQAVPGTPGSIFSNGACPPLEKGGDPDPKCLQIDDRHAVAVGTSMSAPLVAGAVALMMQIDRTLTQDKVLALIQGGAHAFRGGAPFEDQSGPGELDVLGAIDALEQSANPALFLPSADTSWMTLSTDYVAADGSTPLTVILELRTQDGKHRADLLGDRLQSVVKLNGVPTNPPEIQRRGPGVFTYVVQPPPGLGGSSLTLGATFDGEDIVAPRTVPIATDIWASEYGPTTKGGCAVATRPSRGISWEIPIGIFSVFAFLGVGTRRRGRSRSRVSRVIRSRR
jgi:hypothetical protein